MLKWEWVGIAKGVGAYFAVMLVATFMVMFIDMAYPGILSKFPEWALWPMLVFIAGGSAGLTSGGGWRSGLVAGLLGSIGTLALPYVMTRGVASMPSLVALMPVVILGGASGALGGYARQRPQRG